MFRVPDSHSKLIPIGRGWLGNYSTPLKIWAPHIDWRSNRNYNMQTMTQGRGKGKGGDAKGRGGDETQPLHAPLIHNYNMQTMERWKVQEHYSSLQNQSESIFAKLEIISGGSKYLRGPICYSFDADSSTAPVLLADYVTTGNGLKNGVHCGL